MTSSIDDVLSADEQIDDLTDQQLRDCWVRCVFVKNAPIGRRGEARDKLTDTHSGVFRQVWQEQPYSKPVPEGLTWGNDESNIDVAFDTMTTDEPDETLHRVARRKLKQWHKQSGVPVAEMAHNRVSYYTD